MEKEIGLEIAELSDCEKMVLSCIYQYLNKAQEAPDLNTLMDMLSRNYKKVWKKQTVCTFLKRVERKGLISIERVGKYSYYYPILSYEQYLSHEFREICNLYFSGDIKQMKRFVRAMK